MKKIILGLLLLLPALATAQDAPDITLHHTGEGLFLLEIDVAKTSDLAFDFGENITELYETTTPNEGLIYLGKYEKSQPTLLKLQGQTPKGPIATSIVLAFNNDIFSQGEIVKDIPSLWKEASGEITPNKAENQKEEANLLSWIFPIVLVLLGISIIAGAYFFLRHREEDLLPDDFWNEEDKKDIPEKKAPSTNNSDLPFEVVEK